MKAAITGASGLVGGNLAIALRERGVDVTCTRRASSPIEHLRGFDLDWVEADLGDPDALARAFDGADVVFHCAADVSVRRTPTSSMIAANVDGTRHVIDAVRRAGVGRLVHCSSVAACAIADGDAPVTEADPWNFERYGLRDGYSVTKRDSERMVLRAAGSAAPGDVPATDAADGGGDHIDAVVVNPTYMFGPYDAKPSSGRMIVKVVRGQAPGHTDGYNNFVDVRDVCRGMIAASERGARGERYILGGVNLTYREIMARIAAVAGVRAPRLAVPRGLATALGWAGELAQRFTGRTAWINAVTVGYAFCRGYRFSSDKARAELGYETRPIEYGIADAIAWFRDHGVL